MGNLCSVCFGGEDAKREMPLSAKEDVDIAKTETTGLLVEATANAVSPATATEAVLVPVRDILVLVGREVF
jgi:hypothetical protein